jgi:transcriptional regulator of acetoin/glycerol metabolism
MKSASAAILPAECDSDNASENFCGHECGLRVALRQGSWREDPYYRLCVVPIEIATARSPGRYSAALVESLNRITA